jgi:hypothetical protein
MYTNIVFNPAAFKHGLNEDDIMWALKTHICDVLMDRFIPIPAWTLGEIYAHND